MFVGFHTTLRAAGLPVGLTEWVTLTRALDLGLVEPSLTSLYHAARAIVCRDEADFDRFDQAFAVHFEGATAPSPERDHLEQWLQRPRQHPGLTDEEMAKLQSLTLEELRELFERRLQEQKERHDGGSRWIGTGGTSPFGQGGQHPTGMRVGEGAQGRGTAVAAARARRFRNYRSDRVLDTRALTVAIRRLRRLERKSRRDELDIDETIRRTARTDDLSIVMRPQRRNQARVVLLMDTGGSMDPHTRVVEQLFSALKKGGGLRELETYYFHNCVYNRVFSDMERFEHVALDDLCRSVPPNTYLILVGDAWMAPYEMIAPYGSLEMVTSDATPGLDRLLQLRRAFDRHVWINPIPENYWHAETIAAVAQVFPMVPLTVEGIISAVRGLLQGSGARSRQGVPMWAKL